MRSRNPPQQLLALLLCGLAVQVAYGQGKLKPASAVCLSPCALHIFQVALQLYPWCNL